MIWALTTKDTVIVRFANGLLQWLTDHVHLYWDTRAVLGYLPFPGQDSSPEINIYRQAVLEVSIR